MTSNFSKVIFPSKAVGAIFTETGGGQNVLTLKAPASITNNYELILPSDDGAPGNLLQTDGAGSLSWAATSGLNSNILSIISNRIIVFNTSDLNIGYFSWDNSIYSGVTSINCIFRYRNMSGGSRNLILSVFDGTLTSSTTILAGSADNTTSFPVNLPTMNTTLTIRARSTAGPFPVPILEGISFELF